MQLVKLRLKWAMIVLMAAFFTLGAGGAAYAQKSSDDATTLTIGYVNWTEDVAVTHLLQVVLENNFPIDVELRLVGTKQAFQGVASGELDAFLDVWLPSTHAKYWKTYKDQVVDLGVWYEGVATLGIGVPNYVDAQTIADLSKHVKDYGGKIVGIQPGAGIMRITRNKVMPAYGLNKFELTSGPTSKMIKAIDQAIHNHQPIAFTAWKPHWLFSAYPLRYLKDPKGILTQSDHLHAIVREGLKEDAPRAYAVLNTFSLTEKQLGKLELTIANARSAWGGVRQWLADHQRVVAPWIHAGKPDRTDYL